MNTLHDKDYYRRIVGALTLPRLAFIDGRSVHPASGEFFDNINPATGRTIGEVAACDGADVEKAVIAARRAFDRGDWSRAAPERRRDVLVRLAELIKLHAEELAVMESLDSGKAIKDCLHEIGTEVPNFFRWYGELVDKSFGKVVPTGEGALSWVVKEPIGVVGMVLPWNFPLLMAAWKVAPALAAGCSAIVKPAEQTPLTTLRLAELARDAGLPDGVLNVLPGFGETAGQAVGRHAAIDAVSFTGSNEIGAYFLRYAAESNQKPVGLEMGGKSPFIVLDDADITDELVAHAVQAAFWNGGQNCSANMRQIVDVSVKDQFLERVLAKAASLKVGDPLDIDTEIGSMITRSHQARVLGYVDVGKREGARLVTGGSTLPNSEGFFITPAIFDAVKSDMTIAREEIFGPVLGVISVKNMDEALAVACDTEYGLHATVFTRDLDRAVHMARRLPCGTIAINGFTEGDIKTPFGGYGRSGSLARDNGTEAMEQYTQTKSVWINVGSITRQAI